MTAYFYQDLAYLLGGFFLVGLAAGYSFIKKPCLLLIALTMLLSVAGITDLLFRYNSDPTVLLLSEAANVACYCYALTIFLHFSLVYFFRQPSLGGAAYSWWLYQPALVLILLHVISPWMIGGVTSGANACQIDYRPGYWAIVAFGLIYLALIGGLNLQIVALSQSVKERERSLYLMFAVGLTAFYYASALILPFVYGTVNFSSPLPLTCAALILVYACYRYGFFIGKEEWPGTAILIDHGQRAGIAKG